jgi:hypothetical protein
MNTIISATTLISFFAKLGLHIHLDVKNKRFKGFQSGSMQPIEYIFFYIEDVDEKFEIEKKVCNFFYAILLLQLSNLLFIIGLVSNCMHSIRCNVQEFI